MKQYGCGTHAAMITIQPFIFLIAFFFGSGPGTPLHAESFHVTVTGSSSGTGTIAQPWDLQTALNQPSRVRPGDTIWVHGGTYNGAFTVWLQGTADHPIIVRNFGSDHVAVVGITNPPEFLNVLFGSSSKYTWIWGLEFRGSPAGRVSSTVLPDANVNYGNGIFTAQINQDLPGLKIINCVIHDFVNGVSFWKEAVGGAVYGNIIYNNGYDAPDRGHGHGIYTMNHAGRKLIGDNIIFNGYSLGIQAYGSAVQYADSFTIAGNIVFNAGSNSSVGGGWNFINGTETGRISTGDSVYQNYTYRSQNPGNLHGVNFGWGGGQDHGVLIDNYLVAGGSGDEALQLVNCTNLTMTGNTIIGPIVGFSTNTYPDNAYVSSQPKSGVKVVLRKNAFDPRRANLAVYNWAGSDDVTIPLGDFAEPSDTVRAFNAQNFYGDAPYVAVVAPDGSISLPMAVTRWTVAAPLGAPSPNTTFPKFGAFVLQARYTFHATAPTLISPNAQSGPLAGNITFQWVPEAAPQYETQIANDSLFAEVVLDTTTTSSSFQWGDLTSAGVYYWRVRVIDGMEAGIYSPPLSFYSEAGKNDVPRTPPVAEKFQLLQNYPNPFNPSTRIAFTIATPGLVTLTITNALGQKVATLLDEVVSAGKHIVTWNGVSLPSGVYLCRLSEGGAVDVKRMILLK